MTQRKKIQNNELTKYPRAMGIRIAIIHRYCCISRLDARKWFIFAESTLFGRAIADYKLCKDTIIIINLFVFFCCVYLAGTWD